MIQSARHLVSSISLVVGSIGLLVGCGSKDDEEPTPEYTDGTAPADFADYCSATFNEDFELIEFDEPVFTAKAGETYLLSSLDDIDITLLFTTPSGSRDFQVPVGDDSPVTLSCTAEDSEARYVALADVTVYEDEELSKVLCELEAGDWVPTDGGHYYAAVSFDFQDESIYEIGLSDFAEQCGGAQKGYIATPQVKVFDSFTWLIPLAVVRHPL